MSAGLGLGVSWWSYLLKQSAALVLYLKLSFWPHPLVLDYGTDVVASWTEVWWQGPVVLALLAGTAWALVRRPVIGFLGACFFLILAPSSSVVPLVSQTMAEHRMYLPLAAVITLVVGAAARWFTPRLMVIVSLGLAFAASLATHRRNAIYRSEQQVWEDVLAQRPDNARAHNNLGRVHYQLGRIDEAIAQYREALRLDSANPHTRYNLGLALMNSGRLAEAELSLVAAVRMAPGYFDAHLNLGIVLTKLGRAEAALPHFAEAIRLDPLPAEAHLQCGLALAALGRWPEAGDHYARVLALDPGSAAAHSNWGVALYQMKEVPAAMAHFDQALRLEPDLPEVHFNLALALGAQQRWPEARAHLEKTIQIRPDFAPARELLRSLEAGNPP
jgi:tetratricopeptide (TPR) repeat protein